MKTGNRELIEEFFEEKSEEYPELTLAQFKEICFGPWKFLRKEMESGELPEVRFKYFGVFQVYKGRAKHMLPEIDRKLDLKYLTPEKHSQLKTMIIKFLNRNK